METAIFAAGCFWGVQFYFDQVPGVSRTEVGYTGGDKENPSYEDVCYESTGHAEAVKILFDPKQINFEALLEQFFRMHDPSQLNRQGPDVGDQYRSAIFPQSDKQKQQASGTIKRLQEEGRQVVTTLEEGATFWPAEDYHQKYAEKTGRGMCHIPYKAV